ncbi:MAG: glycosyltransferase [Vicinamibacterales bacterium]
MPGPARGVLYVSYDGVLEPLGESQVVAYLERLARDVPLSLLTFEKPVDLADAGRRQRMADRLRSCGITWVPLPYHRRPPVLSTIADVCRGLWWALPRARRGEFAVVHARSYVAALIALALKRAAGCAFLFDMRGFWVDEKADAGQWRRGGWLYRAGKWFERRFFASADAIVSLTRRGVEAFATLGYEMQPGVIVEVIPTCTDLERFVPAPGDDRAAGRPRVVGYVGTLSNWYLREETLAYLAWLDRQMDGLQFLFVTREDHQRLRDDAMRAGIPGERLTIRQATFAEMPALVRGMDIGVFFIRPCFSKLASAATKLGEFLASGVPVVINAGIGDSGDFVRDHGVGVVLPEATPQAFEASLAPVRAVLADPSARARCRAAAEYFRLERGVDAYRRIYEALLAGGGPHPRGAA